MYTLIVSNATLLVRQYDAHNTSHLSTVAYNYVQRMQVPPYVAHVQVCHCVYHVCEYTCVLVVGSIV